MLKYNITIDSILLNTESKSSVSILRQDTYHYLDKSGGTSQRYKTHRFSTTLPLTPNGS
jgi:hypothetical protein